MRSEAACPECGETVQGIDVLGADETQSDDVYLVTLNHSSSNGQSTTTVAVACSACNAILGTASSLKLS